MSDRIEELKEAYEQALDAWRIAAADAYTAEKVYHAAQSSYDYALETAEKEAQMSNQIEKLQARIRELDERLHERDLAVSAMAQQCDKLLTLLDKCGHSITQDIMTED